MKTITCKDCGITCTRNGPRHFYCAECATRRRNPGGKVIAGDDVVCGVCGENFKARQGGNKYCGDACRRTHELSRHHEKTKATGVKKVGALIACVDCSIEILFAGGSHKRCEECSASNVAKRQKKYRADHPEKIKARESLPKQRVDKSFSRAINFSLRGRKNGTAWEKLVGYTLADLMVQLEALFLPGMCWENYGEWHVDHVMPKSFFRYETATDTEFIRCWALSNLQPLWALDNLKKGAKLPPEITENLMAA